MMTNPEGFVWPVWCVMSQSQEGCDSVLVSRGRHSREVSHIPQISPFSLRKKMQIGVFGQECRINNLCIPIWKKMWKKIVEEIRRKCGWEYSDRNAEKSPHSFMEKNVEEMRRKYRLEYSDRNAEKAWHYIRISAITRR